MIITDLFPTTSEPIPEIGLSDTIANLALPYSDGFPNAYYMGWVSWENLTNAAHVSTCTITGNAGLAFEDITTPQNANVGYLCNFATSVNDVSNNKSILPISDHSGVFGVGNKSTSPNVNDNFDFRFINKMSIQKVAALSNQVYIDIIAFANQNSGSFPYQGEYYTTVSVVTLLQFLRGETSVTINQSGFNVTLNINDISDNNTWSHTQNGVTYYVALSGIRWLPYNQVQNNNYNRVYSFTCVNTPAGKFYTTFYSHHRQYIQYNPGNGFLSTPVAFDDINSTFYFRGKWTGAITNDEFTALVNNQGSKLDGTCFFYKTYNQLLVFNILSPSDLYRFFTLQIRMISDNNAITDDFSENVYYPHISPDNEYLCEWLNGDFEDIQDDLRPWQYGDITDDSYNPEELPPYEPPRDENENVGDNVTRPATLGAGGTLGFITQYALRASDLTELGSLLWTSIFTTDYWKNYMFSLALDTGSLDLASILNFFISLRVYPFPLINVPSYSDFGRNMYIGTGIMPLQFTNNLHVLSNYVDYVPGGSVTVDSDNFYHDWRDYVNTEIILYIPYCGTIQLNPGDVVGNEITIQYAVDFATGGCIAYVDLKTHDGKQFVIGALPGQMGADIPLTATAAGQVAARLAGDAMNVAHLIGGQIGSEIGVAAGAIRGHYSPSLGSIGAALGGPIGAAAGFGASLVPGLAGQAVNMLGRGAVAAPMMGGARGFASFGAPQTPYVQIRRGIYPDFGADIMGNAAAGVHTIGSLSGFVSGEIKTDSLTCTDAEKQQIKQLIANGIYV